MYYPSSYHLAQARVADLRRHAQRDTLARAARGPAGCRHRDLRSWMRRPRAVPDTPQSAPFTAAGDAPAR